jgi:hypothetical protein
MSSQNKPHDSEAAKLEQQKKDARAPQSPVKDAPKPLPAEPGKPVWPKTNS